MPKRQLTDLNVVSDSLLVTPNALKKKLPPPDAVGDVWQRGVKPFAILWIVKIDA